MGNLQSIPENHIRIYKNLLAIQSIDTRLRMIETLLASPECVSSLRSAGIYGHVLHYKTTSGGSRLPGEQIRGGARAGEDAQLAAPRASSNSQIISYGGAAVGNQQLVNQQGNERALSYFSQCLATLGLQEEEELSQETLKSAYKRAGRAAHPDKGGSEAKFEAVTRAYAYLEDILRRIHGGRTKTVAVEAPSLLGAQRGVEADAWKHVEPVKLNPKNLNMSAFNDMFEKTKMPNPDDAGYGDWLKSAEGGGGAPKFSGKYNRELFNSVFEEESSSRSRPQQNTLTVQQPQALTMAPMMGDEIGREGTDDFTAPANASVKYTDLKRAYTAENTFSHQVADVRVSERSMKQMEAERGRAPDPMNDVELAAHRAAEEALVARETARQRRAREQASVEQEYFERMKRLVINN